MPRLRLYDIRTSRLFRAIGICQGDIQQTADYVNSAQERLIGAVENGDEGWWGTWAEMAFNVTQDQPYVTLPRGVTRIVDPSVCDHPVALQNQFYQYLRFGNGPRSFPNRRGCGMTVFDRGIVPTMVDLNTTTGPQSIRVYYSDGNDIGRRVLVQGVDKNGVEVITQDGYDIVVGEFLTLDKPFVTSLFQYQKITGFQKDATNGTVEIRQVDLNTAVEKTLVIMEPSEMVTGYRRYEVVGLPFNCCGTVPGSNCTPQVSPNIQVSFMAALEYSPVQVDPDYLLIQSREAIIAECQSIRYSEQDGELARKQEILKHKEAIRYLNGQIFHELGKTHPAINFAPFGSAKLERIKIGMV